MELTVFHSERVCVILFTYQIFVNMMTCDKEAFCPQEIMEEMLVPESEIFFSFEKTLKQMECRRLIGSVFVVASIVADVITTLSLVIKSLFKFFSAKQTVFADPEGMELTEVARIGNQGTLAAETEEDNL